MLVWAPPFCPGAAPAAESGLLDELDEHVMATCLLPSMGNVNKLRSKRIRSYTNDPGVRRPLHKPTLTLIALCPFA